MGNPAAKQGDMIQAVDIHNVLTPQGAVIPQPSNFMGQISQGCVSSVKIQGKPAAVKGCKGKNSPPHMPMPPGVNFQKPPQNEGEITMGSQTVKIGGKPAARMNDMAKTCTDIPGPPGKVIVTGPPTVMIGG